MKGPTPKRPELRARQNRSTTSAVLPAVGAKRRLPPLPKGWQPMTKAWWRDVWRSPMSAEYLQVDTHGLLILGSLIDRFWARPSARLAAEIRLAGACYGLDPIARRRLEWTVDKAETAKRKRTAPAPDIDPRDVLRVVK